VFVFSPKKIICQLIAQGRRPHAYHYCQRPKLKGAGRLLRAE
jgi:hypothetical protein